METKGLYSKYFVLKPRGADIYARASRAAILRYADVIRTANPELSGDLLAWAMEESWRAYSSQKGFPQPEPPRRPGPPPMPQPKCTVGVRNYSKAKRYIWLNGPADAVAGFEVFGRLCHDSTGTGHELWVDSRYDFDEVLRNIQEHE